MFSTIKKNVMYLIDIPYHGKHSRETTFVNFKVLWLFAKVFSVKFGDVASTGSTIDCTSEQSAKVFFTKILFSTNSRSVFSRESFPLYGIFITLQTRCYTTALCRHQWGGTGWAWPVRFVIRPTQSSSQLYMVSVYAG